MHPHHIGTGSTVTAVLGLTLALLTCALIPVDIFLVSSMKGSDGMFKARPQKPLGYVLTALQSWAESQSNRDTITDSLTYAYYAMYALVVAFAFCFIPLAYCERLHPHL